MKDFIRRLIAGDAITSFETQRVTKDGRVLDVWMTVTKLMDEAGKPIGLASTERDITERKLAEAALHEANICRPSRASHPGPLVLRLLSCPPVAANLSSSSKTMRSFATPSLKSSRNMAIAS